MKIFSLAATAVVFVLVLIPSLTAEETSARSVVEKAVQALGGEEKLARAKAFHFQAQGKIVLNGNEYDGTFEATIDGLERRRMEFDGDAGGMSFKVVSIVNKNRAWRHYFDMALPLNAHLVANERRLLYIQQCQTTLAPLKGTDFKMELAGEEKLNDRAATILKITGPDGKDFKLWFDKESGLPVKMEARVLGLQEQEVLQETFLSDYQTADGIRYAGKIEIKREGQPYATQRITSFNIVEKPNGALFDEPK